MKPSRFAFLTLCLAFVHPSLFSQNSRTARPFDTVPFNISIEKLPPNYTGHSLAGLAVILPNWERNAKKSEFETTADYQGRLLREKQKTLVGEIHFNSLMAFAIAENEKEQLTAKYDADLGVMTVTLKMQQEYTPGNFDNPYYSLVWAESSKRLGGYIGRNAFNRAVRVQVYRNDEFLLGMSGLDLEAFAEMRSTGNRYTKIYEHEKSFNIALNMGANEARAVKPNLRALFIGRLTDSPYYYDYGRDTPEIDDPYDRFEHTYMIKIVPQEIWIYNIASGLIYARTTRSPITPDLEPPPSSVASAREPISGGVLNSEAISLPKPQYPAVAKAARASGIVTVQVTIDENGSVISAHAVGGHPLLQAAAVAAARQARFPPKQLKGILSYNFPEALNNPKSGKPSESIDYDRTFSPREVDQKARIISKPEPQYTEEAKRNQISGTVVLMAVLSSSGQVTNVRAASSLPYGLTERAIEAARLIRFTPAMKDGRNVSQYIQLEYNFNPY
jgi:TonB family protein